MLKERKRKQTFQNGIVLLLILSIFVGVAFKLYQLENTVHEENKDMQQYRNQYLQSKDFSLEASFEANTETINGNLEDRSDEFLNNIDITKLWLTNREISERILIQSTQLIYDIRNQKLPVIKEEQNQREYTMVETSQSPQPQNINKNDAFQDVDCILKIPAINFEKPVYNKNTKAYLEKFYLVTAYDHMNFTTGGTYIIYGHNSYVKNLSFQSLPKVQLNDSIIIECKNLNYEFTVKDIQKANTDEISNYFDQEENKIVLVACTNQSTKTNPEYLVVTARK